MSDLGLGCLPMSHKEDARLIWFKGIGKHSSSQCPDKNFDRSAFFIKTHMEKFPLIIMTTLAGRLELQVFLFSNVNLCKTMKGHNFLLGDATYQVSRL